MWSESSKPSRTIHDASATLVAIEGGSMREMKGLDGSNLPLSAHESQVEAFSGMTAKKRACGRLSVMGFGVLSIHLSAAGRTHRQSAAPENWGCIERIRNRPAWESWKASSGFCAAEESDEG